MIEQIMGADNGAHHRRLIREIFVQNINVQRIAFMVILFHNKGNES